MKCLPRDYRRRGRRDVMGLYRESRLCTSCTSGRFSKLRKGEIAPYRTETANTFCQGPVATGWYISRSWRGTCCTPAKIGKCVHKWYMLHRETLTMRPDEQTVADEGEEETLTMKPDEQTVADEGEEDELHHDRLMALLHELVRKHGGRRGAARVAGDRQADRGRVHGRERDVVADEGSAGAAASGRDGPGRRTTAGAQRCAGAARGGIGGGAS